LDRLQDFGVAELGEFDVLFLEVGCFIEKMHSRSVPGYYSAEGPHNTLD